MASKHGKGARASKRDLQKERSRSAVELGFDALKASEWGRAKAERDREWDRAGRDPDAGMGREASLAMREALPRALNDLGQSAEAAWARMREVAELPPMSGVSRLGENWGQAVEAATTARVAVSALLREAAQEGLLDDCRALLPEELRRAGAPPEGMLKELVSGALERMEAARRVEEESGVLPGAEREALERWAEDDLFWDQAARVGFEMSPLERAASMWGGQDWTRRERDWSLEIAGAMELGIKSPAARQATLGLLNRLEGALNQDGEFSWWELGQQGTVLAIRSEGVDPAQAREAIDATAINYWLGLRTGLLQLEVARGPGAMLSDAILASAIERAERNEGMQRALGEHLWLNVDAEGLWRWEAASPSAPLKVIERLDADWGDATLAILLSQSAQREDVKWARPAFEAAGLPSADGEPQGENWFDEGFEERARAAFEGVYALLQARELKAEARSGREASKKGGLSL